jgi:pyruvate formate lyase activating enzyme
MARGQESPRQGLIFNIQRYSLHDGPGIRTMIFTKGCPLRCRWCCNPESQNPDPEIIYSEGRCIGSTCRLCGEGCPRGAIQFGGDGKAQIERSRCDNCGACARLCPSGALEVSGRSISVGDLIHAAEKDGAFYSRSGGGVTVSGGEPLAQATFVAELLERLRKRGVHTAIETCAHGRWEDVEQVCRHADLVICDVKHMDPVKHESLTRVRNDLILDNLMRLSERFPAKPVVARTPIVRNLNDSEENLSATISFLQRLRNVSRYELLIYHAFGESKYVQLGRKYGALRQPDEVHMKKLQDMVAAVHWGEPAEKGGGHGA